MLQSKSRRVALHRSSAPDTRCHEAHGERPVNPQLPSADRDEVAILVVNESLRLRERGPADDSGDEAAIESNEGDKVRYDR